MQLTLAHILVSNTGTGVGAGKFLGVRRIFPEFPQTCPKKFWADFCLNVFMKTVFRMTSKRSSCDLGRHFFIKSKQVWRHFFLIKASWVPYFSNRRMLGANFARIFRVFAQISMDFARIFNK